MTSTNKEVDASSVLASSEDDGVAVCYLCLDAGLLQPLRRDCACRGTDAGFVHLSCLTNYAEIKSKQARGMSEFSKPWRNCLSCHQEYQNEFRIDIATEFVSFVRRQYPRGDTKRQVESLHLKLLSLMTMFRKLQPVQKIEAGVTATVLLSLIDRMRANAPLKRRYSVYESLAYTAQGEIALVEGTEESARRAEAYFESSLQLFEAISHENGIANAKRNIASARSKFESGNSNEEVLNASRDLYKLRILNWGMRMKTRLMPVKNMH
jgi:hypothetical protein